MKLTSTIAASVLAVALAFAAMVPSAPPLNTVELPLLVYAEDGGSAHTESVTLEASGGSEGTRLYVQAHQPWYHRTDSLVQGLPKDQAAQIRVNGGEWKYVANDVVTCANPEGLWGCVAGGFSTIRFTMPSGDFVDGANTIDFRFNGTDGIRSGYRVLDVGILNADSTGLVDGTEFVQTGYDVDPTPEGYDNAQDITAGDSLWHNAELIESTMEGANDINATCSGCHARDGQDLQFFNYENKTIYARSRFHSLSHEEATQIVAYIRSIQITESDGTPIDPPGTPWDPPYQPGPGYLGSGAHPDSADQVYWSAGAGLRSVLERDVDMLPWMFGDLGGHTLDNPPEVDNADYYEDGRTDLDWRQISMDSTLNMRAVPLAIPMPDWNEWLPDIHPADGYGSEFTTKAGAFYEEVLVPAQENYDGSLEQYQDIGERYLGCLRQLILSTRSCEGYDGGRLAGDDYTTYEGDMDHLDYTLSRLSNRNYILVKTWETLHGLGLEDKADDYWEFWEEPLGWPGKERAAFDLGPHLVGKYREFPHFYGNEPNDYYFTHVWYHLQLILNPGVTGDFDNQSPVDWNYQRTWMSASNTYRGVYDPSQTNSYCAPVGSREALTSMDQCYDRSTSPGAAFRKLQSDIKERQIQSQRVDYFGFQAQQNHFALDIAQAIDPNGLQNNVTAQMRRRMGDAKLRSWLDYVLRFDVSEIPREDPFGIGWRPTESVADGQFDGGINYNPVESALRRLNNAASVESVVPSVLDSLSEWSYRMWPGPSDNPNSWRSIVIPEMYDYTNTITPRALRAAPYVNSSGAITSSGLSGGEASGRRFTQQGFTGLRQCGALPCQMDVTYSAVTGPRPQTVSPAGAWTTTTVQGPPGFWAEVERFGPEAESARVRVYHRSVPDALPQRLATTYVSTEDDVALRFRFDEGESTVSALRSSGWELIASAPLELADALDDRPYLGVGIWSRDSNASGSVTITSLTTTP